MRSADAIRTEYGAVVPPNFVIQISTRRPGVLFRSTVMVPEIDVDTAIGCPQPTSESTGKVATYTDASHPDDAEEIINDESLRTSESSNTRPTPVLLPNVCDLYVSVDHNVSGLLSIRFRRSA